DRPFEPISNATHVLYSSLVGPPHKPRGSTHAETRGAAGAPRRSVRPRVRYQSRFAITVAFLPHPVFLARFSPLMGEGARLLLGRQEGRLEDDGGRKRR